ncbi:hypothetical protein ACIBVL_39955 [Streptomyces sp. NPDC049687]|uniref:hypothetical protein n=1 Tax=Streptomyces sp. NPDC049687 TaxID=3365596 RepID=UPI0037B60349
MPKGVMRTHGNVGANLLQMEPLAPRTDNPNGLRNLGLYKRGSLVTYKVRSGISVAGLDHAFDVPAAPAVRPAVPAGTYPLRLAQSLVPRAPAATPPSTGHRPVSDDRGITHQHEPRPTHVTDARIKTWTERLLLNRFRPGY